MPRPKKAPRWGKGLARESRTLSAQPRSPCPAPPSLPPPPPPPPPLPSCCYGHLSLFPSAHARLKTRKRCSTTALPRKKRGGGAKMGWMGEKLASNGRPQIDFCPRTPLCTSPQPKTKDTHTPVLRTNADHPHIHSQRVEGVKGHKKLKARPVPTKKKPPHPARPPHPTHNLCFFFRFNMGVCIGYRFVPPLFTCLGSAPPLALPGLWGMAKPLLGPVVLVLVKAAAYGVAHRLGHQAQPAKKDGATHDLFWARCTSVGGTGRKHEGMNGWWRGGLGGWSFFLYL